MFGFVGIFFFKFFFFFSPFLLPESPLKTSCFSEWAMALHGKRVLRVFSNDQIKVSRNFRQCISCSLVTEDSVRKQRKVLQYQQWSCHSLHLKLFSSRHQNSGLNLVSHMDLWIVKTVFVQYWWPQIDRKLSVLQAWSSNSKLQAAQDLP